MSRPTVSTPTILLAMASLLSTASAQALSQADTGSASSSASYLQAQPAPIERGQAALAQGPAAERRGNPGFAMLPVGHVLSPKTGGAHAQLAPGVFFRVGENGSARNVASDAQHTELRVERGRVDVDVHDPKPDTLVLVDLPGGQTQLLKNGLYTFNADNNTLRVLRGEADAFPGQSSASAKPIKVKEYHQLVFDGARVRSVEVSPVQASADLLPGGFPGGHEPGYGGGGYIGYPGYGFGPFGDGFGYGYDPYFAYGYPFGFGYPFGLGLGFGYGFGGYGFGGYGFRGGYGGFGGFRGRR